MSKEMIDKETKAKIVSEVKDELVGYLQESVDVLKNKEAKVEDNIEPTLRDKYDNALSIWKNNGYEAGKMVKDVDSRLSIDDLCDALSTTDAPILIPKVVSTIVKEAAEPIMVGTSLLQTIRLEAGQQITFPAMSAFTASDIAEGQEYPEQKLQFAGTVTAKIGKSGVKVKFTEEMLRYSQYDVMSMHLRAAGRAMARHKETKIFNMINSLGTTTFDNSEAGYNNTSGRNSAGAVNGTITLDDLIDMYGEILSNGFYADTLIMHPLAWTIFAKDPVMRAFGFNNGGQLWQAPQGSAGLHPQSGAPNGMGPHAQGTNQMGTYTNVPSVFPVSLNVIVSPYVTYSSTDSTCSIIMADSSELGAICVDEDLSTEEFNEPARDLKAVKLRERYGLCIFNEGKAISVAKGVKITKGYSMEDLLTWQAGSGALAAPGTTAIV